MVSRRRSLKPNASSGGGNLGFETDKWLAEFAGGAAAEQAEFCP